MKKSKGTATQPISNLLDPFLVKSVETLNQMPITLEPRELGDMTPSIICNPCVANITHLPTLSEFESSLDDLEDESSFQEQSTDSPHLVFSSAQLKNFGKDEDGGYSLILSVSESEKETLGELLKHGSRIFTLVLLPK